jgi:hypothetical protein
VLGDNAYFKAAFMLRNSKSILLAVSHHKGAPRSEPWDGIKADGSFQDPHELF